MPYIKQEGRVGIDFGWTARGVNPPQTEGELNYAISRIIHIYLSDKGVCYANLNAVIGVLECAKLELYRQLAAPYEDKKKAENGPVSELDGGNSGR